MKNDILVKTTSIATKQQLRYEIYRLRQIGELMSNLCFNLSQSSDQTPENRATMDQLRRAWDAIPRSEVLRYAAAKGRRNDERDQ